MKHRFLLDQNLSPQTTLFLRNLGYDITDTRELNLYGATDAEILQQAKSQNRIVITFNSDFADVSDIPLGTHPGVIRLKIIPQTLGILHPLLEKRLIALEEENIGGCLVIIDNWRIRIRRK